MTAADLAAKQGLVSGNQLEEVDFCVVIRKNLDELLRQFVIALIVIFDITNFDPDILGTLLRTEDTLDQIFSVADLRRYLENKRFPFIGCVVDW